MVYELVSTWMENRKRKKIGREFLREHAAFDPAMNRIIMGLNVNDDIRENIEEEMNAIKLIQTGKLDQGIEALLAIEKTDDGPFTMMDSNVLKLLELQGYSTEEAYLHIAPLLEQRGRPKSAAEAYFRGENFAAAAPRLEQCGLLDEAGAAYLKLGNAVKAKELLGKSMKQKDDLRHAPLGDYKKVGLHDEAIDVALRESELLNTLEELRVLELLVDTYKDQDNSEEKACTDLVARLDEAGKIGSADLYFAVGQYGRGLQAEKSDIRKSIQDSISESKELDSLGMDEDVASCILNEIKGHVYLREPAQARHAIERLQKEKLDEYHQRHIATYNKLISLLELPEEQQETIPSAIKEISNQEISLNEKARLFELWGFDQDALDMYALAAANETFEPNQERYAEANARLLEKQGDLKGAYESIQQARLYHGSANNIRLNAHVQRLEKLM